ncbi:hypothetical protein [Pseudomonas sp. MNR3A]|uniref:hypothetical protein n=1 Tax=Pseudomonas sp. MNR3A TaxID=2615213 RepID=UPI00129A6291|nr:hypothetical protein [Pseudomonas sp. MNR3A]
MNTDPRDRFVGPNPLGLGERELKKNKTGFADMRTHNDYLVFLAGYKAGTVDGEEREYQRHRPMNTEGSKPESVIILSGLPCAGAAVDRDLDKAEGGTPDSNIHPDSTPTTKALCEAKAADNELLMAQVGLLAAVRRIYPTGSRLMIQASGNKIEVGVTAHCAAWWSRPGYIHGKNRKTNKPRTFHHSAVLEVLA